MELAMNTRDRAYYNFEFQRGNDINPKGITIAQICLE